MTDAYQRRVQTIERALIELEQAVARDPALRAVAANVNQLSEPVMSWFLTTVVGRGPFADGTLTMQYNRQRLRDAMARTLAALDGLTLCPHARDTLDPARLPYHLLMGYPALVCSPCLPGLVRQPPDPARDTCCDWCGRCGVTQFIPVAFTLGPIVVAGDMCRRCARGFGLDVPADHPMRRG